jgi:glycosyltransferase involved in cell wall biosynthesis
MSKLAVVIPFLNEGEEVYNTVKNIRETADQDVDIILTNDASTDGYDYKAVSEEFNTEYICHSGRKGVAASRDEAVALCKTDYFLLLDAHMRFFQNDWVAIILKELEKDNRVLLCCKSIALEKNDSGEVVKSSNRFAVYGTYIKFDDCDDSESLTNKWSAHDPDPESEVVDIPCVLGAAYACSKTYWQYLRGLEGLRSYGFDEQLISIKVWLEGGKCKWLKNIGAGHIYRQAMPYAVENADMMYNRLLLAELFLDYERKQKVFKSAQQQGRETYKCAFETLKQSYKMIAEQKKYYKEIFTRDMQFILEYNAYLQGKQL